MHLKCAVFLHFPAFSNIFVGGQNKVSFLVEDAEILLLILTDVHKIIIMKMETQSPVIIKEMIFMMKKWKRILVSALAVTTAAASVSSMSAGAVAFYSTSLEPPKGYTELDDKSFLARATNYSDAYTVYTDGKAESANLYIFEHYMFNNTGILVSDLDTFEKIYAENQAALGFGGYSKIQDSDKNWLISMCDEKNADGVNSKNPADFENKRDAVLKLTRDLQKAGVLLQSTYHAVCAMGAEGNYYNGICVKNVEESEKDAVLRLARTVDSDAEVEIRNIDYGDGISEESINVTKVESIYDGIALAEKLQEAYPAAEVGLEYLMSAAESTQTSGEPVDLTAAYYTGDVDNDEAITSSDLYAVMQYLAWKGSGKEAVTLTTDGEAAEAAALDAADVNGDGKIDTTDMYMILKYCAEKGAGLTPSWTE